MAIDLFQPQVEPARQHPVFRMLMEHEYAAERAVLGDWASGFEDRDGKFVQEFQMTFESGLWELYLNAALRAWGLTPDMSFVSPDFVIARPTSLAIEATIAAPAQGGKPAFGYGVDDIPSDFSKFNAEATLRICNSFDSKVRRYRNHYSSLSHVIGSAFVIAIAAFDRPLAHFAASRPALAAMYGLYHDEDATPRDALRVTSYNVDGAAKSETVHIPLGLFCDATYSDVSAVIYSASATWGKVRAVADNPAARSIYKTFHPNSHSLTPEIRTALKRDYHEDLLDGLWVMHNPFAKRPIASGVLSHPRLAEVRVADDGELQITAPDDFLLVRTLYSIKTRDD
jgi:hypothetical protein